MDESLPPCPPSCEHATLHFDPETASIRIHRASAKLTETLQKRFIGVKDFDDSPIQEYERGYTDKFCGLCGAPCRPEVWSTRFDGRTGKLVERIRYRCTAKRWWSICVHSGDEVHRHP